jgi:peptidoglycan hydrolase CwlO-like protein
LKKRKILISIILVILIFFSFSNPVHASIFSDDDDKESSIKKTIDKEDGGLFEKIIAKMIRRSGRNSF